MNIFLSSRDINPVLVIQEILIDGSYRKEEDNIKIVYDAPEIVNSEDIQKDFFGYGRIIGSGRFEDNCPYTEKFFIEIQLSPIDVIREKCISNINLYCKPYSVEKIGSLLDEYLKQQNEQQGKKWEGLIVDMYDFYPERLSLEEYSSIGKNLFILSIIDKKIDVINYSSLEAEVDVLDQFLQNNYGEAFKLDNVVSYSTDTCTFLNTENFKEYSIKSKGNYTDLMNILIKHKGVFVPYLDFKVISKFHNVSDKDMAKAMGDERKNLTKLIKKHLLLDDNHEFIELNNGLRIS